MNCKECDAKTKKFGKDRHGNQRYRCTKCGKTFLESKKRLVAGMTIPEDKVLLCLQLLCEGNSIRSTSRISGVVRNTLMKLLSIVGPACERFSEETIKGIPVADVQCDEVWSFVAMKEKTKKSLGKKDYQQGDAYTFSAIERNSKMILAWHLGRRTALDTFLFIEKLEKATDGRFQITTDAFRPYVEAIGYSLAARVDFAQLMKVYRAVNEKDHKYSPAEVVDSMPLPVYGNPDPKHICTSHIERSNLSMRMGMRRMTRLTNAFSKKWTMFRAALGLYFAHYNFCRIHQTLRVTPAMEAGITNHVWTLEELLRAII